MRSVATQHTSADPVPLSRFDLHDLETCRLVLRGSSVIDWVRLHLPDDQAIDAFLRVNGYDPDNGADRARLLRLKTKAITFLEQHLKYKIPELIRDAEDVRTLFRRASQTEGRRAHRFYACLTLKAMHIIHHVDGYELLSVLSISDAELGVLIHAKIERVVRGLLERGFPVVEFLGNRKSLYSVYSKLLAKKETQAAQVLDKTRFRIVVERLEDIPSVILALSRELVPFCYVVPGQTHNSLVDMHRMLVRAGNVFAFRPEGDSLGLNEPPIVTDLVPDQRNEFSGKDYRVLNLVADVPLRIDDVLDLPEHQVRDLGPVVFTKVEFQIVDQVTALRNEQGDNRHTAYKARQRQKVKQRLEAGQKRVRTSDAPGPEAGTLS